MKKCIFTLLLFLMVISSGVNVTFAETFAPGEDGYFEFNYTEEVGDAATTYHFEFVASGYVPGSLNYVKYYDSAGELNHVFTLSPKEWLKDDEGNFVRAIYDGTYTLSNDLDIDRFVVVFHYQMDGSAASISAELTGTLTESTTVEPDVTPEVTPDVKEPEEEPTVTPDPTPTNTPTPTLTPGSTLELNAFVDGTTAVAQYYTGGCTPVRSTIEFYEVDTAAGVLSKVNSEEFLSGAGTMRNSMTPGKVYRYKLTYVFQRDGIQYEKFLWSDDLTIIDQELEDYRSNKKITNFRTLMLYVWEDVMKLEIPIEGFHISFQSLFIWVMVAVVLIWFIKKYNR